MSRENHQKGLAYNISFSGNIIPFYNPKQPSKFLATSGIRGCMFISFQFYSPTEWFVWQPEHFEFPSYEGARHKATTDLVEK